MRQSFEKCYQNNSLMLTEGAIGQRLEREFNLRPDQDIRNAALIYDLQGRKAMIQLYSQYLNIARDYDLPVMLFTNTRRANLERVSRSSYKNYDVNRDCVDFLFSIASEYNKAYVGGMMGCKNDGYSGSEGLSEEEAYEFHSWQIEAFDGAKPDFIYAAIMPCLPEIIGMVRAMQQTDIPFIISLMISDSGRMLDGTSIHDAISIIDSRSDQIPLCYMTNCVHTDILYKSLSQPFNQTELVKKRFRGIQANAACLPPDLLDCSCELMTSSPEELADSFVRLHKAYPLKIYGGCCGTDNNHIKEIAKRVKAMY